MDYAKRVFAAESGEEDSYGGRDDLATELGIPGGRGKPLLHAVLEQFNAAAGGGGGGGIGGGGGGGGGSTGAGAGGNRTVPVTAAYMGKPAGGFSGGGGGGLAPLGKKSAGGLAPLAPLGGQRPTTPTSAAAARSPASVVMTDSGDIEESIEIDEDLDVVGGLCPSVIQLTHSAVKPPGDPTLAPMQ
jgi:hypothetical protein